MIQQMQQSTTIVKLNNQNINLKFFSERWRD